MRCMFVFLVLLVHTVSVAGQTITTTGTPGVQTDAPSFLSDSMFKQQILDSTNFYRDQHNATALIWNDLLGNYARRWAFLCNFKSSVSIRRVILCIEAHSYFTERSEWREPRPRLLERRSHSQRLGQRTQLIRLSQRGLRRGDEALYPAGLERFERDGM